LEKVNFDPFLTIFGPFSSRAKIRENMAKRAAGDRKPPLAVRLGHSEGWKPPKVEVSGGKSVLGSAIPAL